MAEGAYDEREAGTRRTNPEHAGVANDVRRRQSNLDLPVALRVAEKALADTSKPIPLPITITPAAWPASERDEIRQRVKNFKAHQEKMAREREDYYLQVKARMLASVPAVSLPTL